MALPASFWLAVIPPVLAILVEYFNPINGKVLKGSATRDLAADFPALSQDDRNELVELMRQSGSAAVEVAGLAPSLITATTSGFAVLHELEAPFWPAVTYILVFVAITLYLLWLLAGLTFAQIDGQDAAFPLPFTGGERSIPLKRTWVVSITIYVANTLLIALALVVFMREEPALQHAMLRVSFPAPSQGVRATSAEREGFEGFVEATLQDHEFRLVDMEQPAVSREGPGAPASESDLDCFGWQRVQVALARRGFHPGPPDGAPGARTRAAIRDFQRTEGKVVKPDGKLTPSELVQLLSDPLAAPIVAAVGPGRTRVLRAGACPNPLASP